MLKRLWIHMAARIAEMEAAAGASSQPSQDKKVITEKARTR